jgi:hypothetical protein
MGTSHVPVGLWKLMKQYIRTMPGIREALVNVSYCSYENRVSPPYPWINYLWF